MTAIDIEALMAVLDPEGRGGRRHADELGVAIRALVPHISAAAIPELVRDIIRQGDAEGRWAAARSATVLRGRTTLPKWVALRSARPRAARLLPVGVPLRDELAHWAGALRLSDSQRQLLLAVNDWLRRTDGGNVPVAAAAERAYELTGDEKAFDSSPPRGGAQLWGPSRLTFELLRCERIPTPLTWEPVLTGIPGAGPIVCVENHATFRTLLRVLRAEASPRWTAVAWVQGRNTAPLESLPDLPFPVSRLDYLGDLDAAGLEIAAAACTTAARAGIAAGPATQLWALLIQQPARTDRQIQQADARRLAAWLPGEIQERAIAILLSGRAIPQEALRFDVLIGDLAVRVPTDVRARSG